MCAPEFGNEYVAKYYTRKTVTTTATAAANKINFETSTILGGKARKIKIANDDGTNYITFQYTDATTAAADTDMRHNAGEADNYYMEGAPGLTLVANTGNCVVRIWAFR